MDIYFDNSRLEKDCNDHRRLVKRFGQRRADLIRRRLDEIDASESLEVFRSLPGPRCHELRQNRAGQLSVDLDHPYRLILVPNHTPRPVKNDGGLDWTKVTAVLIIEVVDTHD